MISNDFNQWIEAGYVPSARLDGRQEWHAVENLRFLTAFPNVDARPHDDNGLSRLKRLHACVRGRTFFSLESDHPYVTTYVTMIHRTVVDWFSVNSFDDIERWIIESTALGYACGEWAEAHIEEDVCPVHQPAVRRRIGELRSMTDAGTQSLMESIHRTLPQWLAPVESGGLWFPQGYENWPWPRPHHCHYDELGVVLFGITDIDEVRLVDGTGIRDPLNRIEASKPAFNYLVQARKAKDAWLPWPIQEDGESR